MSSSNENKVVIQRYFAEVWNARNLALIVQLVAPTCVMHERHTSDLRGPEDVDRIAQTFFHNFPDAVFTITDLLAEGNTVALHLSFHGTNRETGRAVLVTGMEFIRLKDGQIIESWSNWDELGMFKQMGGQVVFEGVAP